jgi:hypothetical protein
MLSGASGMIMYLFFKELVILKIIFKKICFSLRLEEIRIVLKRIFKLFSVSFIM